MLLVGIVGCAENPYSLSDNDNNKDFLIDYISELEKKELITDEPLLVLNGKTFTYAELKKLDLELYRKDIDSIYGYFKKNDTGSKHIYGENGRNGVILINVSKFKFRNE